MTIKNNKTPRYTGDIAAQVIDPSREYTDDTQEIDFTDEQHAIWEDLFAGITQPHIMEHICQEYKDGFELLQLDPKRISTVSHLNGEITRRTGWRVERTVVRYTLADDWYQKFARE